MVLMMQNYSVLMFDGSIKNIANIKEGDVLMGPDSCERIVKSVEAREGKAFEIKPLNGDHFVLGSENYVCLQRVGSEVCCINLRVSDFEKQSKYFKNHYKLYRSGVNFARTSEPSIDSYFLGCLLADGCFRTVPFKLSCGNMRPCQYAQKAIVKMGMTCRFCSRKSSNCFDIFAGSEKKHDNLLREKLEDLGLWNKLGYQKFIPDIYKFGLKNVRFATLAGLIDSDGYLSKNNSVSYCSTSNLLVEDVAFVARSLGFGVSLRHPQFWKNENWRPIYSVCIYGNFSAIPLLVSRKTPTPRRSPKNVLRTGFSVCKLDKPAAYYKLEFYGNNQYFLKSDFMVMKGGNMYEL
jgi:replicative DNA helicase